MSHYFLDTQYVVRYYMKWVTKYVVSYYIKWVNTICPGSSDPFNIESYYIKWVTTSWTHSM